MNEIVDKKLTLEDFNEGSELSPKDFEQSDGSTPSLKEGSVEQIAAFEAISRGTPDKEEFKAIRESLTTEDGRNTFSESKSAESEAIAQGIREDISNLLADPSVTESVKMESVQALGAVPKVLNERDKYSELAVVAESDEYETEDAHEGRMSMIDTISHVNSQKEKLQKAINGVALESSTIGGKVVDLAEVMLPFAEWINFDQLQKELVDEGERGILLGSAKEALFTQFERMPIDKKVEFSQTILNIMEEHENLVFTDGNDLVKIDALNKMLVNNDYGKVEKWFDNITSVLDIIGAGAIVRGVVKSSKASKILDAGLIAKAKVTDTHTKVSPTSPLETVKDMNPEQARKMVAIIADDETGEAAKVLSGASKEDALIKTHLPEPDVGDGTVPSKVKMEGPQFKEPDSIRKTRDTDGKSYLSKTEFESGKAKLIDGFEDIEGMVLHKNSMVVKTTDEGKLNIVAKYSPRDSGFKTVDKAIENASYAFRHYGLEADDFIIYERIGDKLVESSIEDIKAKKILRDGFTKAKKKIPEELKTIDYSIGINFDYGIKPQDIEVYEHLTTKRNLFDRSKVGGKGGGSITQHLLDAASVLHPQIVEPASVAIDKSVVLKKNFIDKFKVFTEGYAKADKKRRAVMTDYINEANDRGIAFNELDLHARGFSTKEIETLRSWRVANDIMYHATNADMAKTMDNRGFKVFVHNDTDTKIFVKPVNRLALSNNETVYDAITDTLVTLNKEDLDKLYSTSGTISRASEPVEVGGKWVDKVVVRSDPTNGYMRSIREDEIVLKYRDGYYPVMYDANYFIQKEIRMSDGTVRNKTIASAKSKGDMERAILKLQESEPEATFKHVTDTRSNQDRSNSFDTNAWSLAQSSGLTAQRARGERLFDAGVDLERAGSTNLVDPLEAVAAQIETVSGKVSMRNYLDTTKQRWISNYSDLMDVPKDKFGGVQYPNSIDDIVPKAGTTPKELADARTLYNYLNTLENGYINSIDEGFKGMLNFGANLLSDLGYSKAEIGLMEIAKSKRVTGEAKGLAFKLYLAANPLRQLVIQGHQTVQLTAIAPKYMVKGLPEDLYGLSRARLGVGEEKYVTMWKELERSGMLDAVDQNNLVRSETLKLADLSAWEKTKSVIGKPINISQRVGFDVGEQSVLISSWLAHRDMAVKAGTKLDRRAYDEIAGKARAFTYNMNKAGDMPYNQNSLNVVAQFLQVPHKAALQMFTNRSLTPRQRAQLVAWNTVMYGVPTGTLGWLYNNMEEGKVRDSLEHGLEDVVFNHILTQLTGKEQQIDFEGLAPTNAYGLRDFVVSMFTSDLTTLITESPSGALLFGSNPRLTDAFKTTFRWATKIDDYEDPELAVKYTDVASVFANTFSGMSNAFKASYAYKNGQKVGSTGRISDSDVTKMESVMQLAGFPTRTESAIREINEDVYGGSSFKASDVRLWYSELKRHLARRGDGPMDQDMRVRVLSEGMRVFDGDRFKFRDELFSLIKKDAKSGDTKIVDTIIKQLGLKTNEEVRTLINKLPANDVRDNLNLWLDNIEGTYK